MKEILYGAAYYDEYMPYERLEEDIRMMQDAGINVVRIGESTWSTYEPQPGVFDFRHLTRVLDAMQKAGIHVIVGTPTYAVPSWLVRLDPNVIADTETGRPHYGARQIMDITNGTYRFYAERIIRKMMETVQGYSCIIGFQIDNETKYYGTAGANVQALFVKYLREKFTRSENQQPLQDRSHFEQAEQADPALAALNREFGLDYWSNRINAWEDFPDVRGTINASLAAEFDRFRRGLVDEFLAWEAAIVREYKRPGQFITQNFDYDWRGFSFGLQPFVNHFHAVKALTVAGADIYHPSQDHLTGAEIAFGGDMSRSLLQDNYLILETQAQCFPGFTPYPGQLRLQAYSHLASGANMVEYWHWHSLHNACETYWKGVLSHDFAPNETYAEISTIGNELHKIGSHLVNLRKNNKAAILVSNEALTGLEYFQIAVANVGAPPCRAGYNDVLRWIYDTLYHMNLECDFIPADALDGKKEAQERLSSYRMIVVPALYAVNDVVLESLKAYVRDGGELVATFKTGFADEQLKVSTDVQPHILREVVGAHYHEFTLPRNVRLKAAALSLPTPEEIAALPEVCRHQVIGSAIPETPEQADQLHAELFMELLIPEKEGATVLYAYDHPAWGKYAAVVENSYGKGKAIYIGCKTSEPVLARIMAHAAADAGIVLPAKPMFPVIVRKGINDAGRPVVYFLNYSDTPQHVASPFDGSRLLARHDDGTFDNIRQADSLTLAPWGVEILEGEA